MENPPGFPHHLSGIGIDWLSTTKVDDCTWSNRMVCTKDLILRWAWLTWHYVGWAQTWCDGITPLPVQYSCMQPHHASRHECHKYVWSSLQGFVSIHWSHWSHGTGVRDTDLGCLLLTSPHTCVCVQIPHITLTWDSRMTEHYIYLHEVFLLVRYYL